MTNDITDRYYDWPFTQAQFKEFLTDKYGAGSEDGTHHYEITRTSGRTSGQGPDDYSYLVECNSDESGATTITNREYEQREQDKKRSIRLLRQIYLNDFIAEFDNLIAE